ncbi:MAG: hypothetical protein KDA67_15940 [Rhodobacteraceae bacterium]|mgnify:CR=1 FL=1|nr:hypothetical protein [Paracoccaceae bacterium]
MKFLTSLLLFAVWVISGAAGAATIRYQGHDYVPYHGMSYDFAQNYFKKTPVGETRTLRFYDDTCAQWVALRSDVYRCGLVYLNPHDKIHHVDAMSEFWDSSYDGATGVTDYSETWYFTVSFTPAYYLGSNDELVNIGNEYWKMLFNGHWRWSYYTLYGGNDFDQWPSFEASVVPALVPLPAPASLLLAGLGLLAIRPRRV